MSLRSFFNWLYSRQGYNFLKTGMYLDHYTKAFAQKAIKQLTVFLGIFFLEKFAIEYLFKKLTEFYFLNIISLLNTKKTTYRLSLQLTVLLVLFLFVVVFILFF